MKVLHLRSEYLDNGPGTQPIKIASEFRKRGVDSCFAGAKGIMEKYIKEDGFTFFEVPELSINKRDVFSVIKAVNKVRGIIKKENISVIHSHNAACSFIAYFACRFIGRKVKVVRSVRGVETRPTHQYRNWLYRFYPATLLAVCEYARDILIKQGARKNQIIVTYNGADLTRFDKFNLDYELKRKEFSVKDDEILIGHVGAFSGWKGQEILISALAKLRDKGKSKVKVMLVGDGKSKQECEKLADVLGVANLVIFVGRVMESEDYHMAFDIYCQPSTKGELFPNSIVEALALEKPWVGTRLTGLPELSVDNKAGFIVEPGNVDDLAKALGKLVDSEQLRSQMANVGYNFVLDNLTIQKVCDRIESAYTGNF